MLAEAFSGQALMSKKDKGGSLEKDILMETWAYMHTCYFDFTLLH